MRAVLAVVLLCLPVATALRALPSLRPACASAPRLRSALVRAAADERPRAVRLHVPNSELLSAKTTAKKKKRAAPKAMSMAEAMAVAAGKSNSNSGDGGEDETSSEQQEEGAKKRRRSSNSAGPATKKKADTETLEGGDLNWKPPEGQTGDGKTALNAKFGY